MQTLKDIGWLVVVVLFAMILIIGFTLLLYTIFSLPACNNLSALNPDYQFQWTVWNGCLVKAPNGRWVDTDAFPYIQGELELREKR